MIDAALNPLTRVQLNQLRKSGRVHFYHSPKRASISTTVATGKRDAEGRPEEVTYELPVASSVRQMSEPEGITPLSEVANCSHVIWTNSAGDHARYWRTIASLLKVGDRLELFWGRDYDSSPLTREAGLHSDRLTLYVHRGETEKKLTFVLPVHVAGNNTARVIRRGRYNME